MIAKLETAIPVPEDDALLGSDLTWKLGGLKMAIPLFTFPAFRAFDRLIRAIKFRIVLGANDPLDISLQRAIELNEVDSDFDLHDFLRSAIYGWASMDSEMPCPSNLAELLITLSWPLDFIEAKATVSDWCAEQGIAADIDKNNIRDYLIPYTEHKVPATQIIEVIDLISKANTDVKKKLLGSTETEAQTGLKPWPNLLQFTFPEKVKTPASD